MPARIAHLSLLIPDYDAALDFFCRIGFECREDTELGDGRQCSNQTPPTVNAGTGGGASPPVHP